MTPDPDQRYTPICVLLVQLCNYTLQFAKMQFIVRMPFTRPKSLNCVAIWELVIINTANRNDKYLQMFHNVVFLQCSKHKSIQ